MELLPEQAVLLLTSGEPQIEFLPGIDVPVGAAAVGRPSVDDDSSESTSVPDGQSKPLATFEACRELARHGIAGIWWQDKDVVGLFAVRPEEAAARYPTLIVMVDHQGHPIGDDGTPSIHRQGPSLVKPGGFIWWRRYDLIDRAVSAATDPEHPLLGWTNGDPFYEIAIGEGRECWIGEERLLGPWGASDGSLAFFTSMQRASEFRDTFQGGVRIVGRIDDEGQPRVEVNRVMDLRRRLTERTQDVPVTVVIDPNGPRASSALVTLGPDPLVITPRAVYGLESGNRLVGREEVSTWSGSTTMHWDGAGVFDLLRLGRSFGGRPFAGIPVRPEELTDGELEEAVDAYLHVFTQDALTWEEASALPLEDLFVIAGWDRVTGIEVTVYFESVECGLRWLVSYERDFDRSQRVDGGAGGWWMGFEGSGDVNAEEGVSSAFYRTIRNLAASSMRRGFAPESCDSVTVLVNRIFRTLMIDVMGYLCDIAWRISCFEEQLARFEELTANALEPGALRDWLASVGPQVDQGGLAMASERLGELLGQMEPQSQVFLSNAFFDYTSRQESPIADYSAVAVGICKALETEFTALISLHAKELGANLRPADFGDMKEYEILSGVRRPTLGDFRHLLKRSDEGARGQLCNCLAATAEGQAIQRSKFRDRLAKITTVYRNGAAHGDVVPLQTAQACIRDVVGTLDEPGALALVLRAKVAGARR
jgi:hypothetical protein